MKTLVLGLGNPILGDDGVGFRVVQSLRDKVDSEGVTIIEASTSGLGLLDLLTDYDEAVIIDAIQTDGGRVGEVYRLEARDFDATKHTASPHDINMATALELGRRLKLHVPQRISIIAIEIPDALTFSEKCSPEVEKAIPVAVDVALTALRERGNC